MRKFILLPIILVSFFLVSCTPNLGSTNYDMSQTSLANQAVQGKVVSIRAVQVSAPNNGLGAIAGGLAGAAGGSAIGGGTRANIVGGVGGAVVGGLLGNALQSTLSKKNAYEYVVRTKQGNLMTVVQDLDSSISVGQHVIVVLSNPAKIIPDTTR